MVGFCCLVPLPLKHPKTHNPTSLCQSGPISKYASHRYHLSGKQHSGAQFISALGIFQESVLG